MEREEGHFKNAHGVELNNPSFDRLHIERIAPAVPMEAGKLYLIRRQMRRITRSGR